MNNSPFGDFMATRVTYSEGQLVIEDGKTILGLSDDPSQPIDLILVMARLFLSRRHDHILKDILNGLARNIEDALRQMGSPWKDSPIDVLSAIADLQVKGSPIHEDVANVLKAMEGTSAIRSCKVVNKITKALGINVTGASERLDAREIKRLVLALRRSFADTTDFGLAVDAKRFGGRYWLAGANSSGQTDKCSITNPVVGMWSKGSILPSLPVLGP